MFHSRWSTVFLSVLNKSSGFPCCIRIHYKKTAGNLGHHYVMSSCMMQGAPAGASWTSRDDEVQIAVWQQLPVQSGKLPLEVSVSPETGTRGQKEDGLQCHPGIQCVMGFNRRKPVS